MMALSILAWIAWIVAIAWLWKAVTAFRGLRRIPNLLDEQYNRTPEGMPSITVIVPARNEAEALPEALGSLLRQDYPHLRVVAVADRSTDATGAIMDALAAEHRDKLTVLRVEELPEGWLGKTHAMALAARHAIATDPPDYLLFTDADVIFHPEAIRRSLAQAVATGADHFVTFPTPVVRTIGEGMLLGYLGVMGLWVTRPWLASAPKARRDFIGIGAFNLLRTPAYQQMGGFDAQRMAILEDLTLAWRIKRAGLRQQAAMAPGMVRVHWASGAVGIVNVMTKNLFAAVRFRAWAVLAATVWIALFSLAPFAWLVLSATRLPALITLAAIVLLYAGCYRHSRISVFYAALFPLGTVFFLYSLLHSTFVTLRDRGVNWRGTFYSLAELRKNCEVDSTWVPRS